MKTIWSSLIGKTKYQVIYRGGKTIPWVGKSPFFRIRNEDKFLVFFIFRIELVPLAIEVAFDSMAFVLVQ